MFLRDDLKFVSRIKKISFFPKINQKLYKYLKVWKKYGKF